MTTTTKTAKGKSAKEQFDEVAAMRGEIAELREKLALARGTKDVTEEAGAVRVGGDLSRDLPHRVEALLRAKPHTLDELTKELGEPAGRVSTALRPLKKHLFNAGTEEAPAWFWIVGDDSPTEQVNAAVEALVHHRPMRFPELLAATGARPGRVSGAIVAMQRDPKSRIANLGTPASARWFWVPEGIQLAKLKRR